MNFYKNTNGGESFTRGATGTHHSEKFSSLERKEIDLMIRNIDTEIYEKYIKRNYGIQ